MSEQFELTIPGKPVAKGRPKFAVRGGKPIAYTPKTTANFENLVKHEAHQIFDTPINGPVMLVVQFYLPRPKRIIWKTRPMPCIFTEKKPDVTNLVKSIEDGLNGIAFNDDSQIAILTVTKRYHGKNNEYYKQPDGTPLKPMTKIIIQKI